MKRLALSESHQALGAEFFDLNGMQAVLRYEHEAREYAALRNAAGILDLSWRGRLCLLGPDRARFLHGQVTNDINRLGVGDGCYAALVTAKGKMESDVNVYALQDELLLDFEPGLQRQVTERLEKFIVADDVQMFDAAAPYGLLSIQGPKAPDVIAHSFGQFPSVRPFTICKAADSAQGEIYIANQPRFATCGFDVFVPAESLAAIFEKLHASVKTLGGCACGWNVLETSRIEAGIPRFGADMDASTIPLEAGLETNAVSFSKGCYIGQEVINRIRSIGHVTKSLRGLKLADGLQPLPNKGDKLFSDEKEVGYITSATRSPALNATIALGYVRRETNTPGQMLTLRNASGQSIAQIVELPFV